MTLLEKIKATRQAIDLFKRNQPGDAQTIAITDQMDQLFISYENGLITAGEVHLRMCDLTEMLVSLHSREK